MFKRLILHSQNGILHKTLQDNQNTKTSKVRPESALCSIRIFIKFDRLDIFSIFVARSVGKFFIDYPHSFNKMKCSWPKLSKKTQDSKIGKKADIFWTSTSIGKNHHNCEKISPPLGEWAVETPNGSKSNTAEYFKVIFQISQNYQMFDSYFLFLEFQLHVLWRIYTFRCKKCKKLMKSFQSNGSKYIQNPFSITTLANPTVARSRCDRQLSAKITKNRKRNWKIMTKPTLDWPMINQYKR